MENESNNKIEGIIRDNLNKVSVLLDKIVEDYKNSIIDPINLEEIRKLLKVSLFSQLIIFPILIINPL